jgi:hypothetical protein
MIKIIVEQARVPSSTSIKDFAKVISAQAANAAAEGFANEMKKHGLEKKQCEAHPNHTSTVVVKALDTKELMRVEKRNFCCRDLRTRFR